jgi:hypothetical protein
VSVGLKKKVERKKNKRAAGSWACVSETSLAAPPVVPQVKFSEFPSLLGGKWIVPQ